MSARANAARASQPSDDSAIAGERSEIALVTGAGRGIGRAIAIGLGVRGSSVCLAARTASELDETARLVRQAGGQAVCLVCDVTDESQCRELVQYAVRELGGLSILVNNAGGAHRVEPLHSLTLEEFDAGTDLNYMSAAWIMRAAAPHLRAAAPRSSVLNVVSIAAFRGLEGMGYYSAAKAALVALTRATAREWGPSGVRVNALAPGWVATSLSEPLRSQEQFARETLAQIPLRRWGNPEEVADAALFLVSERARYITGECLVIDGGLLA